VPVLGSGTLDTFETEKLGPQQQVGTPVGNVGSSKIPLGVENSPSTKAILETVVGVTPKANCSVYAKQFRHYGPVAQNFFAAFGDDGEGTIGSPTTITSTDMNGVLMLAVQALGQENDAFEAENAELKARIEALERLVKGMSPKVEQ
jgi:hypothetical protein